MVLRKSEHPPERLRGSRLSLVADPTKRMGYHFQAIRKNRITIEVRAR
jgi:hypothetical protein